MITEEKLKVFKKYKGDIDFWAQSGSKKEQHIILDEDWYIIMGLIQDINLIDNNLASKDFEAKVRLKLEEICVNKQVKEKLIVLAKSQ